MSGQTKLEKALAQGQFAVVCQCPSVRGTDLAPVRDFAAKVQGKSVAVVAADNPGAKVGASALAKAVALLGAGVEPVMEMSTRDRNRMALESDLLGAGALGVRNVLCTDGTHPAKGDHPQARRVYDVDAVQWTAFVKKISQEKSLSNGLSVSGDAGFFAGGLVNPFVKSPEMHLMALKKKVRAGAGFLLTEPVQDPKRFGEWLETVKKLDPADQCPVIGAVLLTQEGGAKAGLDLIRALQALKGLAGVCILAPECEDLIPEVLNQAF